MDAETKIVQELASTLPKEAPITGGYPEAEKGETTPQPESGLAPETPEDPFQKYQTKQEILKYFEVVPDQLNKVSETVDSILEFVKKEIGSHDLADIIQYLNQTERMLGTKLKGNRLLKIQQFATIRNQKRLLEQKERALYG